MKQPGEDPITRIVVFQERGSGEAKVQGIRDYGRQIEITRIINIDEFLPELIDEPEEFISDDFSADLVISFLKHPDLLDYLVSICKAKKIPVIASGKKALGAITPFTCCGLGRLKGLGAYGDQFGVPEFSAKVENNRIKELKVLRGASCGATWQIIPKLIGLTEEEALECIACELQFLCLADPSSFDPVSSESPLHFAGHAHERALRKCLNNLKK
ncbi:MAG: DUF166 family (seleno)protein DfsP [Thermodesulfobacteriota bacterium]|nr:DUF166 family (seleno)protein DfsP [Thermodesulfobacteriota bacterium]